MADVLRVSQVAKLEIRRNDVVFHFQNFASEEVTYTRHAGDRVVLAAAMGAPSQANLGDIGVAIPGKKLIVEVDRPIQVAINDSTKLWPVEDILVMASAGITSLWFQNLDATNTATVTFLVTD